MPGVMEQQSNNGQGRRGAVRGLRYVPEVVITRHANAPTKQGTSGRQIVVKTNYFRLRRENNDSIFRYDIEFEPMVEDPRIRLALIRTQGPTIGPYILDGTMLFLYNKLRSEEVDLQVKDPRTDALYQVKIRHVGTVDMMSEKAFMILNLMHRQAMGSLKLLKINRNFFDPEAKITIPQFGLEMYPGYVTSIRQHERDVLMCVDVTHRVLRTDTCYRLLENLQRREDSFRDNFRRMVIGANVMSMHNQKMYKVCDVDYDKSPSSSFVTKEGASITFMDYYNNQYNITIRDPNQPMLAVSLPGTRMAVPGRITPPILLVPELCRMTGITDEMRCDFQLMRELADHEHVQPDRRIEQLESFNERLQNTPASQDVFRYWKTELDHRLLEVPARTLPQESILLRQQQGGIESVWAGSEKSWSYALHRTQMFKTVPLHRWYVLCEQGKESLANDFLHCLMTVARTMNFNISQPTIATVENNSSLAYIRLLSELLVQEDLQMVMCIVPDNRADRYSAIKRKCFVERALPCQVILERTITPKNGNVRTLMSVATKVVIQLNCKLGGIPWMVKNPLSTAMVVGFDVCHDTIDKSKSYGALVATMYASQQIEPKYFSTVELHQRGEEWSNCIATGVAKALHSYQTSFGEGKLPRRIIVYRDGVGKGQLRGVVDFEVQKIKQQLMAVYANAVDFEPQLSVIVVNKRNNTRLFLENGNPPPGTIVDDIITLPERSDFFLISQPVCQGTVSPTSYNVVHDESGLTADQLQVYTFKQTHLYYNWCGTIAVPAVCQYAHKLAFLAAKYLHNQPNQRLENQLYYL